MRRMIFLGTGAAMSTECYNACFLIETPDGDYFLTDAGGGNGILRQMKRARVDPERLRAMFLTHGHMDHILGAAWIVRRVAALMCQDMYAGEFHIYGHGASCQIVEMMSEMLLGRAELRQLGTRILLHELQDGEQARILNMKLTAFDVHAAAAKQFGYRLRFANRRTLVCLGDAPYHERARAYAEKADWLVTEAFCLEKDRARFRPEEKHHSTVREAAANAAKLGAKRLVLFHTEDTGLDRRKALYAAEAAEAYAGRIFVPDDLEAIEIG